MSARKRGISVVPTLWVALMMASGMGVGAEGAGAQDIEAVAEARGIQLPQAYYELIARDSTAFTLPNGLFRTDTDGARMVSAVSGNHRLLVLPALFADSNEPHITSEMVNQSLFVGPAERGTVTEAYLEMSRGALTLSGTVTPWVRTSIDMMDAVGLSNGLGADGNLGPYFLEALELADATVDYGEYDNDGPDGVPNSGDDDGFVDAMTFEFLEVAGSCGGESIWPHRWGITGWTGGVPFSSSDARTGGGVIQVNGYIVQSVTDCGGVSVQDASTIAHEYGHVLGLPDYYHPMDNTGAAGRRWVLGCWALMAAGSWGCGPLDDRSDPFGPSHMSVKSKDDLGWSSYIDVGNVRDHEVFLDPIQTSGRALRIPLDLGGVESLLVEYRTQEGFDVQIPAEGVLIYHLDAMGQRRPVPNSGEVYYLSLVEQDGNKGLQRNSYAGGDRGVAADAWGRGGVSRPFHWGTVPSLRLHSGFATSVVIHELAVEGGRARVRLSTAPTPVLIEPEGSFQVPESSPFEERMRVAGGTMPYQPVGSVPAGVTMVVDGDELVVSGTVTEAGPVALLMAVEDALGNQSPELLLEMNVQGWSVAVETLLGFFLGGGGVALTSAEQTYLDAKGNVNGGFDVGDLRKWMRESAPGG